MSINFNSIDGYEFENLIEQLLQKMGFLTKERKRGADGGIDILAINQEPILQGEYIIQCKKYSSPVGVGVIRDLYGVVHARNANKGIIITNSSFTKDAIEFSKNKQLELIGGEKLLELLMKYKIYEPSELLYNIPNGMRVCQHSMINPLKRLISIINDYKRGIIYVNKIKVTDRKWHDNIIEQNERLLNYSATMTNIFNNITPLLNSNLGEDMEKIQNYSKYIVDANKMLLSNYERMLKYEPPEIWLDAHNAYLKVYESFFGSWESFIERLEQSLKHIPDNGNIELTLLLDNRELGNS